MKKNIIPHSRPTIGKEEIEAVSRVIASGRIAQGGEVEAFENEFARKIGVRYAAAVNSGTAALHLALIALGATAGDEIIIPSFVCTALLNAVNYTGATSVVADIDPGTLNIDPGDVERRITPRTKAIIVPHMFGLVADLDRLTGLGVPVIEDCAQAAGALYKGDMAGSKGNTAIFSFYATKMLTTGEGGMVVSDSKEVIDRVRQNREYDNRNSYSVRYNYKMTDIQAAMGRQQLKKLADFVARRREIAGLYTRAFRKLGFCLAPDDREHVYYRYIIKVNQDVERWIKHMATEGVSCAKPVFKPLHLYNDGERCSGTDSVFKQALSIPIFPSLSETEIKRIIMAVIQTDETVS
jgi:perosamine synthetase